MGQGREAGLERTAASLDAVLGGRAADGPRLLLELTAGQGTVLGSSLGEIARMIELAACGPRLGLCVDTCHAFAAGYALDEAPGYEVFWREVDTTLGFARLGAIHLNDSLGARGSHRDRHANLGDGLLGFELFARLLRDERLARVPMLLETPMGDDGEGHARDLARLRALAS
jgi:deoxyribonuclease-4